MASSGPNNPNTMTGSSYGPLRWNTADEAKLSNDSYTYTDDNVSTANTYYLKATDFGFAIPSGSIIDGIKVEVEKRYASTGGSISDNVVKLIKAGSIVGDNATFVTWELADTYATYGGSSSLWGNTWTYDEINALDFGFAIAARCTYVTETGGVVGYIDHIRVTVYYSSSSFSPSISPSVSPSQSISPSISPSVSPSVSPTPSPGFIDFTKGSTASLPSNDNDLPTTYTAQEIEDVSSSDETRACQDAISTYVIHQYKDYVGSETKATLIAELQSGLAPTYSTVYLQIYNHDSNTWTDLTSNNTADADTDFTLSASVPDLTNYKDASYVISWRVYQENK